MALRTLLPQAQSLVESFVASSAGFRIVDSQGPNVASPRTLFILDSSFNPPHVAHLTLATSALQSAVAANRQRYPGPHRLLLLFSTHNADKQPAPAAFEHRLAMMMLFAEDLLKHHGSQQNTNNPMDVDVGLTKQPFYTAKTTAIEASQAYPSQPQHIHLVGYDTFVRIFEPKYYADHNPPLSALSPLFARHGLRITLRPEPKWGDVDDQRKLWQRIQDGGLEADGGKREWAEQIEVVDSEDKALGVSSTAIRQAAAGHDWDALGRLCTPAVSEWIQANGLYSGQG